VAGAAGVEVVEAALPSFESGVDAEVVGRIPVPSLIVIAVLSIYMCLDVGPFLHI
jgi:hypothetical protein